MKTKLLSLAIMMLCLIGSQSAMFAQTVYVNSSTGNDGTGTGSSGSPYKTFTKGYAMTSVGGTLDLTGTFTLTDAAETGDAAVTGYTIDKNINIQGQGADQTVIQAATTAGTADRRIFTCISAIAFTIKKIELRYGVITSNDLGGAMYLNSGNVSFSNCYIHDNRSVQGGAIGAQGTATVTIIGSTLSNNTISGTCGGAIYMNGYGGLALTNSTISGNSGAQYGGGIELLNINTTNIITNCTIVNNSCRATGTPSQGGGIEMESSTLQIKNTIIANNTCSDAFASADFEIYAGTLTDNGYNIVEFSTSDGTGNGAWSGTGTKTGDQVNLFGTGSGTTTPSLALNSTANGTPTLALSSGSVAMNAGSTAANGAVSIPTTDQRGFARVGATDIGAYEYGALPSAPTITGISPTSGLTAGGTSVIITGTNFTAASVVKFGSINATSYTVNSATQITAVSPAGSAGAVDITVTTTGGTTTTSSADKFTYVAAPTITGIAPTSGQTGGSTSVVITGTNFLATSSVKFGSTNGTSYTVNSATQITAVSPAGTVGGVDITVTTAGGTSATSSADQFMYIAAPTITGISPTSGPTGGSTSVVITGTNFLATSSVKFGSTNATSYTVNSATQITAVSPAGAVGGVDITVTTTGGTSATSSADQFTYVAAPTVTSISPTVGSTSGGTSVVLTGTNLTATTAVKFGTTNATSFTVNSATQITAVSPAGSTGKINVTVTTPVGTSATSGANQFTYLTPGTWTGNANSSNWTDANNWAGAVVPNATTDVTIPSSGITYLPMIFPTDKAECNNLTSSNGLLEIVSSSSGTGSLIVNGTSSGPIWSDIYIPANKWTIIAPPCDNSDISSFISSGYGITSSSNNGITTYSIKDFNEGSNAWNSNFTSDTSGSFALGKGYSMQLDASGYVSFYGSIVSGTKNISLTKTGQGWNCIGNPYTSAIDINATATNSSFLYLNTITNTGILDSNYGALYFWNESAGQYNVISNATLNFASKLYSQNYAATGDAFFVKAATNGASLSFTRNMQSHQNVIPTSTKTSWPAICIKVTNNSNTSTTVVAFNNAMTNGLDAGYDAGLLRGTSGLNIYTNLVNTNGNNFAIQCLPETYDNTIVPIAVESTSGGTITFSAETVSLPAARYATLEDKVTGTLTDLKSGQTYSVSVTANSVLTNRFFLHTSKILPAAVTGFASNITTTTATLNGSVNAYGASTTVTFEYGLTTSYGTSVTANQSLVTGTSATAVSKAITGLAANITYHFRVNGVNATGTTNGIDQTFTTSIATGLFDVQANALSIYPNPATDFFTIKTGEKSTTVFIYNLSGSLILSKQIIGESYINISSLQQGVYVVKANGLVGKLVKK